MHGLRNYYKVPGGWRVIVMLLVLVVLSACGTNTTSPLAGATEATPGVPQTQTARGAENTRLNVVVTFSILGDLVQNVAGDKVELRVLIPPGSDAHTFEPSPADVTQLAGADLIFENGLGFETWIDDLYKSSGSRARRVVVSEGITLIEATESDEHEEEHADEEETAGAEGTTTGQDDEHAEHGEYDPHVWHDVANAVRMVEHIRDALVRADGANAGTYRSQAASYLSRLQSLDDFVVQQAGTLAAERRKLVTTHDTFSYFARRYGFEIVGTALGSVSTEVADPAAAEIVKLVEQIKAAKVPAIFAENVEGGGLTERIAREAGVALAPTLYTDALGNAGSEASTYEAMVRYNVVTIVTALSK